MLDSPCFLYALVSFCFAFLIGNFFMFALLIGVSLLFTKKQEDKA
jgi:hypothetical protein